MLVSCPWLILNRNPECVCAHENVQASSFYEKLRPHAGPFAIFIRRVDAKSAKEKAKKEAALSVRLMRIKKPSQNFG